VLTDLWACKLTAENISDQHFEGENILLPSIDRVEELSETALLCAERYEGILRRMVREQPWCSKRLGETRIDFRKLKEVAEDRSTTTVDNLIAFSYDLMLVSFGEQAQVLDEWRKRRAVSTAEDSRFESAQSAPLRSKYLPEKVRNTAQSANARSEVPEKEPKE
jgi:hypothetical protein